MSIDVTHQNGNVVITATANSADEIVGTECIRGRICGVDRVGMYHAYIRINMQWFLFRCTKKIR